jgi:hypothetical protein
MHYENIFTSSEEEQSSTSSIVHTLRNPKRVRSQIKEPKTRKEGASHSSIAGPSEQSMDDVTDGFLKPKKTARRVRPMTPFIIPTTSDVPREPEHLPTTPSTVRKPPPIYIDYPPSEANSSVIRKWLSGLKGAASFRRFNELQYVLFPQDEQAARILQTHFTQRAIPYFTHALRHVKRNG